MRRRKASQRNGRDAEARGRALAALARMRRDNISLVEASRLEHIKPSTFLRYVGSAIRQDKPGGRFRATAGDRFRRDLQIPTALGPTKVPVYGRKAASNLSKYANAINRYLRTGDASRLKEFKGKTIRVRGQKIKLITDPRTLSALAEADALRLDQLYASLGGAA
ncbi:MAG: hypothetical protein ACHP78_09390 [Terriglobales bacterium]